MQFEPTFEMPAADELSSVHVIPFVDDDTVVTARTTGDEWILPGGTIEPGEHWHQTAARELREEIGATMLDLVPFGILRWHVEDPETQPKRPDLPWPDFCWVIGVADVVLDGAPASPETTDCEPIFEVACLPLEEAARRVARDWAACTAIYRLAADIRANTCGLRGRCGRGDRRRPGSITLEDRRPYPSLGQLA